MRRLARPLPLTVAGSLAVAVILASGAPGPLSARQAGEDWPQWRGPRRDGVSAETGLLSSWPDGGPRRVWTGTGLGIGFSSVAVANGRVYTMGDRGGGQHVIAIDDATGREAWATRVGEPLQADYSGPRSTPTVDGDRLYVLTSSGDLVCLESATGRVAWRKSLPRDFGGRMMSSWHFSESPLVDGDRVVVTPGGARAAMVALDKRTGGEIWRAAVPAFGRGGTPGAGYASIVVSHGGGVKQYVQLMGQGLVSIRATDGWFLWGYDRVANSTANIATPIVRDDLVFGSSSYGAGSALLRLSPAAEGRVTAREEYFLDRFENHHGGVVEVNGYLYGGHGLRNGFPVCLELATGRSTWSQVRGAGTGSAAVAAADGHLYFRYEDGTMALIEANPERYVLKSRFEIPGVRQPSWPHPVIAHGRLYLREQDALHVYDIRQ